MSLLEAKGVTKRFGGLVANDRVDLCIEKGQIVGLIGPNGSGKSTFFNCVSGYYGLDGGQVLFDGHDITNLPPNRICTLGIARTFQLVRAFASMTVLDNVMVGSFVHTQSTREARATAMEVLEFTGLADKAQLKATELTVPDQKRMELSRALATRPKLLLLDEVMAGLTPKETTESGGIIKRISESVSHC